ncbi:MAG: hypothetical protein RID07_10930, partial [Lacipirellulaceae bacterium]
MSEEKSDWDDLAKELGVDPSAGQPDPPRPEPSPEPTPARELPPPPEPQPGDWDALAGELGIEVPEPVEPAQVVPDEVLEESVAADTASEEVPPAVEPASNLELIDQPEVAEEPATNAAAEFVAADPELEEMFAAFARPAEKPSTDLPGEEDERQEMEAADQPEETAEDASVSEVAEEQEEVADSEVETEAEEEPEKKRPSLSGEAARSAFDALFASGAALFRGRKKPEQSEPLEEETAKEDKPIPFAEQEDRTAELDPFGVDAAKEDSSDSEEDEERPKKRRRRRRGSRGSRRRTEADEA